MHILADENIALAASYFAPYGRLTLCPGRSITREKMQDVDVLLVRSVTRVDAALLAGTQCRYVGTATSGIDHVDTAWLASQGIAFGWARGCNAEGVVDYVLSVCAALAVERDFDWIHTGFGIVGCGEIGSRLARRLLALGVEPRIHDPLLPLDHPLAEWFRPLERVLDQQVVSLHVPLTDTPPAPTRGLINADGLKRMGGNSVLINAARGGIVDEAALLEHCERNPDFVSVVDAWQHEPAIDARLLEHVTWGTPHIAGYSHGGKVRGTRMIHADFCRQFALDPALAAQDGDTGIAMLDCGYGTSVLQRLSRVVLSAYDLREDSGKLRQQYAGGSGPAAFDQLRRDYPLRREFSEYLVRGVGDDAVLRAALAAVGIQAA